MTWSFPRPWSLAAGVVLAGMVPTHPRTLPRPEEVVDPRLYAGLQWRNLGPFRGGRVAAVSGAIGQPGVFYAGYPAAGVWKTTSAGITWFPVFDSVRSASSVGAVEVAPSDPKVIYVGMGDLVTGGAINEGDGVYRSSDAGQTWRHLGLDATKQIPSILVDPRDPNATAAELRAQHVLQMKLMDELRSAWQGYEQVAALRGGIGEVSRADSAGELASAGKLFGAQLDSIGGLDIQRGGRNRPGATPPPTFRGVSDALVSQLNAQDNADLAPTPAMLAAYRKSCGELQLVASRWRQVVARDLDEFNAVRRRNGVGVLVAPSVPMTVPRC